MIKDTFIKSRLVFFFVCLLVIMPRTARAYLDPGTGSYIIQVIIASVLGASFAFRHFWRSLSKFMPRFFLKKEKKYDGEKDAK